MHYIQEIVKKQKNGEAVGVYSCCSANEYVLRAAMRKANQNHGILLIEATANQVNQDGGYTGMRPGDFCRFVKELARKEQFPENSLILGGDHLGPLTWTKLNEKDALQKSIELVRQYVEAGFTKIHIDTSMRVADDDASTPLSDEVIAIRGAILCEAAERAFHAIQKNRPGATAPIYIIGSEVPIPGGAQEAEDNVAVTTPGACAQTIETFRQKFLERNLCSAWARVVGIVVQPGVEFGDAEVFEYNRKNAQALTSFMKTNEKFILEGHSTDYQTKENLKEMVEDGIAILKVGPALTYYLREGLFALESIEKELLRDSCIQLSNFRDTLESVMIANPGYWHKHYRGTDAEQKYARAFSLSDRCRYYLNDESVRNAISRLLSNLNEVEIPFALLSQYMPTQYTKVRQKEIKARAEDLLLDHVGQCCDDYLYATGM